MDPLWKENVSILLRKDRIKEFWPNSKFHINENVNAFSRFCLYAGLILTVLQNNPFMLLMSLSIAIIFTKIAQRHKRPSLYKSVQPEHTMPELNKMVKKKCLEPSNENPFANVTYFDYENDPNRPPACSIDNVKENVNDKFFHSFPQSEYDLYNNGHSQRQFFSMPNTTIPNDQASFAKWLYGDINKTCKSNPLNCTGTEAFGSG